MPAGLPTRGADPHTTSIRRPATTAACCVGRRRCFFCRVHAWGDSLRSLLARCDMVLITEAHGTSGQHKAWTPPQGTTARWSAGPSTGHAGVGIIVKNVFLQRFAEIQWETIWPGRALRLRLRGKEGALDVIVSYFHTGAMVQELDMQIAMEEEVK